jgi:hypothetical protein
MKKLLSGLLITFTIVTGLHAKRVIDVVPPPNGGCTETWGCDTLMGAPNGIKDNPEATLELNLYPNPASSYINVRADFGKTYISEPVYINIINMRGSVVKSVVDYAKAGSVYSNEIDIRGLPDDEYIFQLIKGNRNHMKKFQVYY